MAAFSKEVSFEVIWKPFFLNPTLTKALPLVQHLSNMYGPVRSSQLLLCVPFIWRSTVVGRTSNIKTSRRHLADYVKSFTKKRTARVARLYFLIHPVKYLICGVVALIREFKGLAKLGNIVAETLLRMQMFPSFATQETCCGNKFCCSENKKCFCLESKTFLLPGNKFCVRNICFPV